ncbi:MAG TPA: D-2-hydroxyacid dehydrogenase [Ohtaekwangia sp.]|nr:D-2-hydroxyacid dehydrogenase [Ohtaekwangia sp.]
MKDNIVITDGFTLNPGDLSWKPFEGFGDITYFDRTPHEKVAERCQGATIIMTNKTPIDQETIESAPNLKVIAVTATGYNIIDIKAAQSRNILVCNVPGYGTDSVAQHTFALLLELTNHVGINSHSVKDGAWAKCPDFCYSKAPLVELASRKMGLVGYGEIGQKVAEISKAFGMDVNYYSPSRIGKDPACIPLEKIFSSSDVVSLHCPLTPENTGFVDQRMLAMMKPTSYLINTSRGQLINENDLAHALKDKVIAGAALDVLAQEPPLDTHPLTGLVNCIITPHNAWSSFAARKRIMDTTYDNVKLALDGKPQHVVHG